MSRILVTGGAGFIGSHLVDRLVARDETDEIVVADSLWTGREENLSQHRGSNRVRLFRTEIERADWKLLGVFDEIYHLASPASPAKYLPEPRRTMTANFSGAVSCLNMLMPGGLMCFTSTSEVYGDPLVSPQPESYKGSVSCTGPRACYDESKRAVEALLLNEIAAGLDMTVKIARIFNCYGPRTQPDDGRAVSNFISQALSGEPVQVYGTGEQTRCFGYVDDIVDGLCRLFWDTPDDFSGPLNIGCDRETPILEIAEHVARALGVGVVHVDPAVDDPQQRRPDLTLARQMLPGWECRVSYEEGVARTIKHFREVHGL